MKNYREPDEEKELEDQLDEINKNLAQISKSLSRIASTNTFPIDLFHESNLYQLLLRVVNKLDPIEKIRVGTSKDRIEHLQEEQLDLTVKQLKQQERERLNRSLPKYNPKASCIVVNNLIIQLSPDSNEARLCEIILSPTSEPFKSWSWDEIVKEWGDDPTNYDYMSVYRTGKRINQKVSSATDIMDLFNVTTKEIQLKSSHFEPLT